MFTENLTPLKDEKKVSTENTEKKQPFQKQKFMENSVLIFRAKWLFASSKTLD